MKRVFCHPSDAAAAAVTLQNAFDTVRIDGSTMQVTATDYNKLPVPRCRHERLVRATNIPGTLKPINGLLYLVNSDANTIHPSVTFCQRCSMVTGLES
jgi:hypothetical protein